MTEVGTRPLRIGLDGRAFSSPAAGVRRYVSELSQALSQIEPTDPPIQLVALGGRDGIPPGVERVSEPWHPPTNLGWNAVGLARAVRRARVDLYHAPAYTAPIVGVHPLVLTIHDVSYERHPAWYPHAGGPVRRSFYRASARAADRIITDSMFSKQEIVAAYGIPDDRITVIPLGVSRRFCPGDPGDLDPGVATMPYVLHVGDLHPRRNLSVALEAVLRLRSEKAFEGLTLVLAGVDRGSLAALEQTARQRHAASALRVLGPVGEDRLVRLYRGAAALVYPSRYEGFGLPIVEAMACGLPVIAARTPVSEEITAGAAALVPCDEVDPWVEAIRATLVDPVRRGELARQGLDRARGLSWRQTADATLEVYRRCARLRPN